MKSYQGAAIAAFLATGAFAQWPACANTCVSSDMNSGTSYSQLCNDQSKLNSVTSCLSSAGCSSSDEQSVYSYINQMCANTGATITSGLLASYTKGFSSGVFPTSRSVGGFGGAGFGGKSSDSAAFASYTAAHPNGPSSGDWASFTSAYGISSGPWGTGTPTAGWQSQITGGSGFGGGAGGFHPGGGQGPFGGGAWGQGSFAHSGSWTAGPWTSWWNGNSCPSSDWPGWTSGSWSTSAPWTTWSGCSATATATSVYTTTSSNGQTYTTTGFGYQLAQVTGSSSSATTTSVNGANGLTVAGGAAAAALMGAVAML